ncbi:probable xyloglucan endotransglucosylase/hydrolase protein 26 [Henckelia pumila]|uniref:probable xyloglucan endotransglucosylase/hydrolase protein 26 n=1 Tax=Henckelia pumila TaxID=405737 RepID=UPI003C6E9FAA
MAKSAVVLRLPFLVLLSIMSIYLSSVEGKFKNTMFCNWGAPHYALKGNGDDVTLVLDQESGSGIESNRTFLFGTFEMQIKLVPGNSAGTVTAYYLSSIGDKHDEIDFEFLGNVSGQPYTIHTNIFSQGCGGREQQFHPWFDPTADFHNYTIHWSPTQVIWYVDRVPIRVYNNYLKDGIPYPNLQEMRVYSSLWNADSWATRGGLDKIDWRKAPFAAELRNFRANEYSYDERPPPSMDIIEYDSMIYRSELDEDEKAAMKELRKNHMTYDYCKDVKRYRGLFPGDCFMPQH